MHLNVEAFDRGSGRPLHLENDSYGGLRYTLIELVRVRNVGRRTHEQLQVGVLLGDRFI